MTFFSKRKSVSSKTRPLCQGLPCQGSWRASARLRGWTKDAFRVSGITQVLLCTTSPSSSLRSMPLSPFGTCVPPPPAGGVFPSRGGFGIPSRFPANANQFHRKRNLFAKGSPTRGAVERMRDGEVLNPKTPSRSSQEGVGQALVYASMPWSAGG